MRGAPDDLRCPACAQKKYAVYLPATGRREVARSPVLTTGMVVLAVVSSVLFLAEREIARYLIASPEEVWDGQVWRLVTTVFVHGSPLHLLFDIWFIWAFGRPVELWLGPFFYAGFVILTAAAPISAELMFSQASAIGLSGVGFALFGLHYALRQDKDFAAASMSPQTVQWIVAWFFLCIVLTYTHIMPVANVAHAAGALLGWLFGRAALATRPAIESAGVVVLAVVMTGGCLYMPWSARYAVHRFNHCLERDDIAGQLYWLRKAHRLAPDNDKIGEALRELEDDTGNRELAR
jgi:membrane associated rhomboid family serine protease